MCWCKRLCYLAIFCAYYSSVAAAGGFVLGLGVETDTAEGKAVSGFADFGVGDDTWLSAAAAMSRTGGTLNLDTVYFDGGIEHSFGLFGARAGAAYWGDKDILDSVDLRGSLFVRGDQGTLSANFERRDFDFTFQVPQFPDRLRTAEFSANGLGLSGRLVTTQRTSLFFGGMSYQYSRDISLQPNIDVLRLLSSSRLSLMNSLLDYRGYAGIEWRFDLTSVDLRFEQWQTAIDQGKVNSLGLGVLMPIADRNDLEIRLSYDESDHYGRTLSLAAYLYYFGGSL